VNRSQRIVTIVRDLGPITASDVATRIGGDNVIERKQGFATLGVLASRGKIDKVGPGLYDYLETSNAE
jgi:hypothetical protein